MAHTFKVWIEIEELDEQGDTVGLEDNCGLPDPIGEYRSLKAAQKQVAAVLAVFAPHELKHSDSVAALRKI